MKQLDQRYKGCPVAPGIQASRGAVVHAFLQYPWLINYPINPATSARYRSAFTPSGARDGLPDASVLLDFVHHQVDKLRHLEIQKPVTVKTAGLVETRRHMVNLNTALPNAQIKELFVTHPNRNLFRNVPGAGPQLAARLCVAFGTITSVHLDPASLQKYAGVAPVREISDNRIWTYWRWGALTFLRQTVTEPAGQTVRISAGPRSTTNACSRSE